MSSEENSAAAEIAESNNELVRMGKVDLFLVELISMADEYRLEQGVTLNVGGAIITGQLISGREYFKEIGDMIRNTANIHGVDDDSAVRSKLAESYGEWAKYYPKEPPTEPDPDAGPQHLPGFIHLRGAKMLGPNRFAIPNGGTFWRGKLSAVDGFMLGTISLE